MIPALSLEDLSAFKHGLAPPLPHVPHSAPLSPHQVFQGDLLGKLGADDESLLGRFDEDEETGVVFYLEGGEGGGGREGEREGGREGGRDGGRYREGREGEESA